MGYVNVAGLTTWHEVSGAGDAVVLLHGAFAGAMSWSAQSPAHLIGWSDGAVVGLLVAM